MQKGEKSMKRFKKLLAIVLAMAMTLAMTSIAAYAEGEDTYPQTIADSDYTATIKFVNEGSGTTNHKYTVYQIFTADSSVVEEEGDDALLMDIEWGLSISATASEGDDPEDPTYVKGTIEKLLDALKADTTVIGKDSVTEEDITFGSLFTNITYDSTITDMNYYAQAIAAVLNAQDDDGIVARTFAQIIAGNSGSWLKSSDGTYATSEYNTTTKAYGSVDKIGETDIGLGYYLVTDAYATEPGETDTDNAISRYILAVIDGTEEYETTGQEPDTTTTYYLTINTKAEVPTLDKEIVTMDNTGTVDTDKENTATVGDVIYFELTTAVPDMTDYVTYTYIIKDTLADGLSLVDETVEGDDDAALPFVINVYTTDSTDTRIQKDDEDNLISYTEKVDGEEVTYYLVYTLTGIDKDSYDGKTDDQKATYDFYYEYTTETDTTKETYGQTSITITFTSNMLTSWQSDAANSAKTGDVIKVEYSATLTDEAAVGYADNMNEATLTYSDDPQTVASTSTTTTTETDTHTTQLTIVKHDGTTNAELMGAEFTIYQQTDEAYDSETSYTTDYSNIYVYLDGAMVQVTALTEEQKSSLSSAQDTVYLYRLVEIASTTKTETDGQSGETTTSYQDAVLSDLGAGSYILVETTTPSGYNTMDPLTITVTYTPASTDAQTGVTTPASWTIKYSSSSISETLAIEDSETTGDDTPVTTYLGTFTMTVDNYKGAALPTTGGMGTTVLYVIGIVLVLGAGVVLVSRRRMSR